MMTVRQKSRNEHKSPELAHNSATLEHNLPKLAQNALEHEHNFLKLAQNFSHLLV